MNGTDRATRDKTIERLHRAGVPQVEIGRRVGMAAANTIYGILQKRGALPIPVAGPHTPSTIWDEENPYRIRMHNWHRQRAGARAALEAMK